MRFCILFLFSLATMMNAVAWICFAPIFSLLQEAYGTRLIAINYLSSSYMIMFAPLNFPSVFVLDKYGLRVGVCLGIILTSFGMWLRCLINQNFYAVLVGQTVCAIA